jgi:hypothetical protein
LGYLIWNIYYFDGEVPHASKDKRSFWWRDVLRLVDWFRGIAKCKVGDETTVSFGKISGMIICCNKNSQYCTHLLKINKSR